MDAFSSRHTDRDTLRLYVHGTPYQWHNPERPWIAVEAQAFAQALSRRSFQVYVKEYFGSQPPSLDRHFELLKVFCRNDILKKIE